MILASVIYALQEIYLRIFSYLKIMMDFEGLNDN